MPALSLSYYYYPQYPWAKRLGMLLRPYLQDPATAVVDAPCGDGVITYWMLRSGHFKNPFELFDLSPELIAKAQTIRAAYPQLTATSADIGAIPVAGRSADLWLLVNSLYLLPDIDGLVDRVRPRFRTVVGVFPYIDRENYRRYLQFTERWENANAMEDAETVRFFARHGYRLDHREDATHLSQYRWNVRGARRFLNVLDPLFQGRPGNYWLAIFSRI